MNTNPTRTISREDREQQEAAAAYRRQKMIRLAYRRARADGGPLAEVLTTPERPAPGCIGFNSWLARRKREQRRQKRAAQRQSA